MIIHSSEAFVSAIIRSPRPITLLLGSAISLPDETSIGVPGVSGIISRLTKHIDSIGLTNDYKNQVSGVANTELYQHSFEFLSAWDSQDAVNKIISDAVKEAFDNESNKWGVPQGVHQLCELINSGDCNVSTILTTNFDPLIQKRLNALGRRYLQFNLDSDGTFTNVITNDNQSLKIIHLHGFWENANTLHTQTQLRSFRPNLKSSLIEVLSDTTLVVIGYGGWEDILMEALEAATFEKKIDVQILWAFYDPEEAKVDKQNRKLFEKLGKFVSQGKFKAYCGVDCKTIFGKVLEKKANIVPAYIAPENIEGDYFSKLVERRFYRDENHNNLVTTPLKPYSLLHKRAHERIRSYESKTFLKWSGIEQVIILNQSIGMGGEHFLASVLNNNREQFGDHDIYKVDLSGVNNLEDMGEKFKSSIGVSIEVFTIISSKKNYKTLLLMDGVSGVQDAAWRDQFTRAIKTLLEIGKDIQIVICGNIPINDMGYKYIELKPLDEVEVKLFITDHVFGKESHLSTENFNLILSLCSGNPTKLDGIIDKLRFESIDEIARYEFNSVNSELDDHGLDEHLRILIDEIMNSTFEEIQPIKNFLMTISLLTKGETIENVNRFFSRDRISPLHLKKLLDEGIISLSQESLVFSSNYNKSANHFSLNPLVSSYIKSKISREEANELLKDFIGFYFGKGWFQGKPKLNSVIKSLLLKDNVGGQSNAHISLTTYLNINLQEKMTRDLQRVINVSLYFSKLLYEIGRYRDAIMFCEEILLILKNRDDYPVNRIYYVMSESYRMISDRDEAIIAMEKVLDDTSGLAESEIANAHMELSLAYYKIGNTPKKIDHAKCAIKLSKKGDSTDLQCQVIIASELDEISKSKKLNIIERKARRLNYIAVANNIILTFAVSETSNENKLRLYEKVLSSTKKGYNHIRAIVHKAHTLKEMLRLNELTPLDKIYLCDLYGYLFTQRIHSLFNLLHSVLWEIFKGDNNINSLVSLLKHSSVIWRLSEDEDSEQEFLKDCKAYLIDNKGFNHESSVSDYIALRLEDLSSN